MQKNIISIGDRIELLQIRSALHAKVSDSRYTSQLLDYDGIRTIKISMPIYEGKMVPLEVNDVYELCFFASKGMYRCQAKIMRRYRERKLFVLQMQMISQLTKFQRREFYRLDCMLDFEYRVVSEEEKALQNLLMTDAFSDETARQTYEKKLKDMRQNWEDARMTDISGGGMRFQCDEELEPHACLKAKVPLNGAMGIEFIQCNATVIETITLSSGAKSYEARCQFEAMDKQTREKIIKYIFEEQKRRIRKD